MSHTYTFTVAALLSIDIDAEDIEEARAKLHEKDRKDLDFLIKNERAGFQIAIDNVRPKEGKLRLIDGIWTGPYKGQKP